MMKTASGVELKLSDYLTFLSNSVSALSDFPKPIVERSNFISWVSARVLLAMALAKRSAISSEEAIKGAASEIRLLLIAALIVIDQLADELQDYVKNPKGYEFRCTGKLDWRDRFFGSEPRISKEFNIASLRDEVAKRA